MTTDEKKLLDVFTVHDFNEALYSTLHSFVPTLNFAQAENISFYFIMEDISKRVAKKRNYYQKVENRILSNTRFAEHMQPKLYRALEKNEE